jgi:Tol biopolymer transport system component
VIIQTQFIFITLRKKTDEIIATNCEFPSASSWSPDGNSFAVACHHILVFSNTNGEWSQQGEINIPDKLRKLPPDVVEAIRLYSPAWSPDGERTAFVAPVETGDYGPYIVNVSCVTNPTNCVYQNTKILQTHANLIWSSDPSILGVEIPYGNRFNLYDIKNGINVKSYLLNVNDYPVHSLAWTPDNKLIAFEPQVGGIYTLETNNDKATKIYDGDADTVALMGWINISSP